MDENLKEYADTVYEGARMESSRAHQRERLEAIRKDSFSKISLPLTGTEIQLLLKISTDHIERCMAARLDSYKEAFAQINGAPSDEDLALILEDCRGVRTREIKHAIAAIRDAIGSRGVPFLPNEETLEQNSAYGHDRVLDQWKIWKAKVRLKPLVAKVEERKRQFDVMVATFNKAAFELDLVTFTSKSTEAQPCSLLFLDLDHFKSINDTLGHQAGDRVLKLFAQELVRACEGKGSVYRNGGDEFCVLLPNHSVDEAKSVAERVLREMRAIKTEDMPNGLSTSIGVACFADSADDDHSKLLSRADKAVYISKGAGRNRVSVVHENGLVS
jgi:diguanylate cyclase (GGDEF)-like protein